MMIEKEKYFIKLPNNVIWTNEEGELKLFDDMNQKTLLVLSKLMFMSNPVGECNFTPSFLIESLGYKPRSGKGNINEQFKEILHNLEKLGFICNSNISMKDVTINTFISCNINPRINKNKDTQKDTEFFQLYYDNYEKILSNNKVDKVILLNVYCYINARIFHRPKDNKSMSCGMRNEGKAESTYFTYEQAIKDLKIAKQTFNDCIAILEKNKIIYVDNIGYVLKDGNVKIANNVYALTEEELISALDGSRYYYENEGYNILGKDEEYLNYKIKGVKGKIKQLKQKNKNTDKLEQKLKQLTIEKDLKGRTIEEVIKDTKSTIDNISKEKGMDGVLKVKNEFENSYYKIKDIGNDIEKILELENYCKKQHRKIINDKKIVS